MNKNNFSDTILNNTFVFDYFDQAQWKKQVFLQNWKNKYAALVHASTIDLFLETKEEGGESEIYILSPIDEKTPLTINFKIDINHSDVKLNVHLVAFLKQDAPTTLNASILMKQRAQNSSTSLLEESVILSPKINIKSLPVLDIQAKNIQASHWAKIYRLDGEKLFYLESKWLDRTKAQEILLSSFPEKLFEDIGLLEEEKNELLERYFTFTHK